MISAWSKVRAANRTERIDMINGAKLQKTITC
jgi:hypothetical protein